MPLLRHRFGNFLPPDVCWVFLGTFNPDAPCNPADFYYSRRQNHFWRLLPEVFGLPSLKGATAAEKIVFSTQWKVGFVDLICCVDVPEGCECTYDDAYIDDKVAEWNDVTSLFASLPTLRHVLFTRKTFQGIPNIQRQVTEVQSYCVNRGIKFSYLTTPARIYTVEKLTNWSREILNVAEKPAKAFG